MPRSYINIPITVNPEALIEDAYAAMAEAFPGWEPSPGQPEVWLIRAITYRLTMPLAEMAADVPGEIFGAFGRAIVNVPPIEANPATGNATVLMTDNAGYTLPAGTQVDFPTAGDAGVGFRVVDDVSVPNGSVSSGTGEVLLEAVLPGADGNGLSGNGDVVEALAFISSITLVGTTAGGTDPEDPLDYLNRLADTMQTLAPRPIIARDVEIITRGVPGVWRATALDNYNPAVDDAEDPGTWNTEKMTTVAIAGEDGGVLSGLIKTEVESTLGALREANFIFNVIDPTYSTVNVNFVVIPGPGFDQDDVNVTVAGALAEYLSPANWAQSPPGDTRSWVNRQTLYYQDLVTVVNNQEGVDRYTTLEVAINGDTLDDVDIQLAGAAPLPAVGEITASGVPIDPGGGGGGGGGLTMAALVAAAGLNATPQWTDDCSVADPIASPRLKWCLTDCERIDGDGISTEFDAGGDMGDILADRFVQHGSGGPGGAGWYALHAAQSDTAVFASPPTGRAAIGYPKFDPGSTPTHDGPSGAGFFYEGRRHMFALSTRLPFGWDTNLVWPEDDPAFPAVTIDPGDVGLPVWRVLAQWKQNEWIAVSQDSPQLSFQQRDNVYMLTCNIGGVDEIIWSVSALGTVGSWRDWLFDIHFSQDAGPGSVQVYCDADGDGLYEYDGGLIEVPTLCNGDFVTDGSPPRSYAAEGVEAMWSPGTYEGFGGDTINIGAMKIFGVPGG